MSHLYRLQTVLTGLAGGTGLATFHFNGDTGTAEDAQDSVDAFWAALQAYIHTSISATPTNEVVTFESTTGEATSFGATTGVARTGSAAGTMNSPATQGLIRWRTAGVVAGRRVAGRTFIPGPTEPDNDIGGKPVNVYLTALATASTALLASATSEPVVWSRPIDADPEAVPPVEARLGSFHPITAGSAWTQWAVLRGRRDS
jgi:hypothetical protein